MQYAKIVVKNSYEQRGDLVLRSYIRALKKIGKIGELFLNGEEALIFGVIDSEGKFHEILTNSIIDYNGYSKLTDNEYNSICEIMVCLSDEEINLLKSVMEVVLFEEKKDLGFEISTMEDLAQDRSCEFDAYNCYLSRIDPYPRLTNDDDPRISFAYNILSFKIRAIKEIKRIDSKDSIDSYDIINYESIGKQRGAYKRK